MWQKVFERFEQKAPAAVMARVALEQALPASFIDEVFEHNRTRQYARELLFSKVVELMTLVTLGLRPSLHAAARQMPELGVSLAALYDKVRRTEPEILRALVVGSAQRLEPIAGALPSEPSLPGWKVRILDGNHLPGSEKRLQALRDFRGAALPGHTLVVYDPDSGLVQDIAPCEDAYESERTIVPMLMDRATAGQLWIADSHFCTRNILQGFNCVDASFIVREHGCHPVLIEQGQWGQYTAIETGRVREQSIEIGSDDAQGTKAREGWRRIEIELATPTESGESTLRLWTNLPAHVTAESIANLYRKRWRIEGMFQRLESVLHSEIKTLGHPKAALLGFAVAVLAYNVLSLMQRCVEQAHRTQEQTPQVSTYHLAQSVKSGYEGMLIALPAQHWPSHEQHSAPEIAQRLLELARRIPLRQVLTSVRCPKKDNPKGYVAANVARAHTSTARVLKERTARP